MSMKVEWAFNPAGPSYRVFPVSYSLSLLSLLPQTSKISSPFPPWAQDPCPVLQVWGRCLFFARAVPTWTVYSDISALWDQTRSPLVLCSFPVHSTAGTLSAPSPNTTASETAPLLSTLCCVSHSAISDSLRPHGLSMGFSRQEYWSGLPFPSPGDLPDPEIELRSPPLPSEPPGKPLLTWWAGLIMF